jgi:hypothetical protein
MFKLGREKREGRREKASDAHVFGIFVKRER